MKKIIFLSILTTSFLAVKSQELKPLPNDTTKAIIHLSTGKNVSGYIVKQSFDLNGKVISNSRLIYLNEKKRVIPTVEGYKIDNSEDEFFLSQSIKPMDCP